MGQSALIDRISGWLQCLPGVVGAFLGGSFGRGEADDHSDVDVFVVATNPDKIPSVLESLVRRLEEVSPILFSRTLPNARTVNAITEDWLRFDLTVVAAAELALLRREAVKPLFDPNDLYQVIPSASGESPNEPPETLIDIVNEFIRVLGLSVVVKERDDLVVAQTGTNLMRDMLIQVMVLENGIGPRRGVLALKRDLTQDQTDALLALPPPDATWASILRRTEAIARQFLPRARRFCEELGGAWPREFERVTLAHVSEKLGLKL